MPALEEELGLDVSPALQSIEQIDKALQQVVEGFKVGLSEALDLLAAPAPAVIPVTADTSEADAAIADAETVDPATILVDADTDEAAAAIGDVEQVDPVEIPVSANTDDAAAAIGDLEGLTPEIDVAVTADPTDAEGAVDDVIALGEGTEIDIPVTADTSDAQTNLEDLKGAADDASGKGGGGEGVGGLQGVLGSLGDTLGEETATTGAFTEALAAIGPEGVAAAAVIVGLTAAVTESIDVIGGWTEAGAEVVGTTQQLDTTFGEFAATANKVKLGDFTENADKLALSLGVDKVALEAADAATGGWLRTLGLSQSEAADWTAQINSMAAVISAARPNLGTMDQDIQRITQAIVRGRPLGLKNLGLDITKDEIEARANAMNKTTTALTGTEKATIILQLAQEKLHQSWGDGLDAVTTRQQNAEVQLKSLQANWKLIREEFTAKIAVPVLAELQKFKPLIEDLIPIAGRLGSAIARGLEIAAETMSIFGFELAGVAKGIAAILQVATHLPFIGGSFKGPAKEAKALSEDLYTAAHAMANTGSEAEKTGKKSKEAGGDMGAMGNDAAAATDQISGLAAATAAVATAAVQNLPTAQAMFATFADSISAANAKIVSASQSQEDALKASQKKLADAKRTAAGGVKAAQEQAAKDIAAGTAKVAAAGTDEIKKAQDQAAEDIAVATARVAAAAAQGPDAVKAAQEDLVRVTQDSSQKVADAVARAPFEVAKAQDALAQVTKDGNAKIADAVAAGPETVKKAQDELIQTTLDGAKKVKDAQDELAKAADPKRMVEALFAQIVAVKQWGDNLDKIASAGLFHLLDSLIAQGPEKGGEAAKAFADSISAGKPEMAVAYDKLIEVQNQQNARVVARAKVVWGPEIGDAYAGAAATATTQFGENLTLDQTVAIAQEQARKAVGEGNPHMAQVVDEAGKTATAIWKQAYDPATPVGENTAAAGGAITLNNPTGEAKTAGGVLGTSFGDGFQPGADIATNAHAALVAVFGEQGATLVALTAVAANGGSLVGRGFMAGIQAALTGFGDTNKQTHDNTVLAMTRFINDLIGAAKTAAGITSPSKAFAEIGAQMGAGLVQGLQGSSSSVSSAGAGLARAAVPSVPSATVAGGAAVGQPGAAGSGATFYVQVNLTSADPAQAAQAGRLLAESAERALQRRGVIARVRTGG